MIDDSSLVCLAPRLIKLMEEARARATEFHTITCLGECPVRLSGHEKLLG